MMLKRATLRQGYTLLELMVAVSIGTFVMASAFATIMSLAKGSQSVINYTEMNTQSRHALEWFGRDARMADDVLRADEYRAVLEVNGVEIEYRFEKSARVMYRTVSGQSPQALIYDVEDMGFNYFTLRHNSTNSPIEVKHIQLEAMLERRVLGVANTNYIISARFMMRNKHVSN